MGATLSIAQPRADYTPRTGFVTLQFDDTHYYDCMHIFPILEEHGFKGSFGYITEVSDLGIENSPWMMQAIYQAGHEVQDHTTRHDYMWASHVDSIDDDVTEWVEYTFADVATWDSLCERSLYILDSLGIEVIGWNHPGGTSSPVPGHPGWKWLGAVNDSMYELIGTKYPYALGYGVPAPPNTAHLNLRGHNYPDRFPFFNVPHVTIDYRSMNEIKMGIADAVASGLWYLAVCHVNDREKVAKVDSLADWLVDCDVEVLKCCDGWQRIQYGDPDPCANQFPQARMLKDLDSNGKPDGFVGCCTWDTTTVAPVDDARCMQVYDDTEFYCYGPELGQNAFSLWVKSTTGSPSTVTIVWAKMDFDWTYLEDLVTLVQVPTEWTRVDTSGHPNFLIPVEDEVDRIRMRLLPDTPILVAYPEMVLAGTAGVAVTEESGGLQPVLRIVPNPVMAGVPFRIGSAGRIDLYDALGRRILSTMPSRDRHEVVISTSGLPPGVYFVRRPAGGHGPAKVVVCK
ncbi:MAG: polysaccharide deacetylase family protein [Candidatus Eisenbacteria bacterium]